MTPTIQPLTYHCPYCNTAVEARPGCADEVAVCPSCHQPFKFDLPAAKPEEPPPAGIVLPPGVEPAATPPPEAVPVTAPPPAPVAEVPVTEPPEIPSAIVHVSMWRRYPLRCLGYAAGIIGGVALMIWLLTMGLNVVALVAAVGLAYLVYRAVSWWLMMRNTTLTITDRRCIIETGVFRRESTEFGRKDVTNVHVSQSGLMRILDVADLVIHSDNGEKREIVLMAVPHPDAIVQMIAVPPAPQPVATAPAEATSAA